MIYLIWTLIIIWLFVKITGGSARSKKTFFSSQRKTENFNHKPGTSQDKKERDLKKAAKKHSDLEGEYVDYEEVK
jgi:hypothetical protein